MILYLDSSALVKLLHVESGTEDAQALWEEATVVVTSRLAYAESRAALASIGRRTRARPGELRLARKRLEAYVSQIDEIDVDESLSRLAGEIAERWRLRGADAVHLASALSLEDPELVFATWDHDLASAARDADLQVVPASR